MWLDPLLNCFTFCTHPLITIILVNFLTHIIFNKEIELLIYLCNFLKASAGDPV